MTHLSPGFAEEETVCTDKSPVPKRRRKKKKTKFSQRGFTAVQQRNLACPGGEFPKRKSLS